MVNGLKTDMEHKNTNDKNEYHFQLPEVVVKGKMPGWMRMQLGMALHRNPALFRKCMKNATSLEEKQFYFNLAFNAAREEAGQQFVQAALTAAGVISAISTAGVSLAAATSFGRQAALLGRGALLKGSTYAGRIASSIEAASLRGGMAVQNTIMRSATHLRTLSNITGRMLYPKGLSFDTMLLMGASDLSFQFGSKFAYNYFYWGKNWKESGIDAIQKVNITSVLSSSLGLPLSINAAMSAAFDLKISEQRTIFDSISTTDFLINYIGNFTFGKAMDNVSSKFFQNMFQNKKFYIPYITEKEIQQINRSLHKWGDGTMNQMEKGMISIYQVWYEEQIDSILKFNLRKTNIKIDEE